LWLNRVFGGELDLRLDLELDLDDGRRERCRRAAHVRGR
jgi:hypothetical protein